MTSFTKSQLKGDTKMSILSEKSSDIKLNELQDIIDKHLAEYELETYQKYFVNGISIGKRIHRNPILEVILNRKYEEMALFTFPENEKITFVSKSEKISNIIKELETKIPYTIKIIEDYK